MKIVSEGGENGGGENASKANMDDGDVDDGQQYGKCNLLSITKKGFKFITGSGLDQFQCAPSGQINFCCTVFVLGQGDLLCWTERRNSGTCK